ncbi:hypothetical protein GA0115252_10203 [Streptomyces sp. DfronAA-171]|nr:hypothetical protein GA0115252_10203 [Streptomyces sp. DfronAA-171]
MMTAKKRMLAPLKRTLASTYAMGTEETSMRIVETPA